MVLPIYWLLVLSTTALMLASAEEVTPYYRVTMTFEMNGTVPGEGGFRSHPPPQTSWKEDVEIDVYEGVETLSASENFLALAEEHIFTISEFSTDGTSYKDTFIHRVQKDVFIQGGELLTTPISAGADPKKFIPRRQTSFLKDKESKLKHWGEGWISMMVINDGVAPPNHYGSQFFICLTPMRWMDDKHVVFGKITKGLDAVRSISRLEVDWKDSPVGKVKIVKSIIRKLPAGQPSIQLPVYA